MSEASSRDPRFVDPELTLSQRAVKELCDEILAQRPPYVQIALEGFKTQVSPGAVQRRLRGSSLVDLMLRDGDSLSAVPPNDYHRDIGLLVCDTNLVVAEVRAQGWEGEKRRIDPDGPDKPPYKVVTFPGEKDWRRRLEVRLWYGSKRNKACQVVSAYTESSTPGELPEMSRDVFAAAYEEMGYEGHNQVVRPAESDVEVLAFVSLARELFNARIVNKN